MDSLNGYSVQGSVFEEPSKVWPFEHGVLGGLSMCILSSTRMQHTSVSLFMALGIKYLIKGCINEWTGKQMVQIYKILRIFLNRKDLSEQDWARHAKVYRNRKKQSGTSPAFTWAVWNAWIILPTNLYMLGSCFAFRRYYLQCYLLRGAVSVPIYNWSQF